jgi:hypothetical protein
MSLDELASQRTKSWFSPTPTDSRSELLGPWKSKLRDTESWTTVLIPFCSMMKTMTVPLVRLVQISAPVVVVSLPNAAARTSRTFSCAVSSLSIAPRLRQLVPSRSLRWSSLSQLVVPDQASKL